MSLSANVHVCVQPIPSLELRARKKLVYATVGKLCRHFDLPGRIPHRLSDAVRSSLNVSSPQMPTSRYRGGDWLPSSFEASRGCRQLRCPIMPQRRRGGSAGAQLAGQKVAEDQRAPRRARIGRPCTRRRLQWLAHDQAGFGLLVASNETMCRRATCDA